MSKFLNFLYDEGVEVDEALERLSGDEELYLELLLKFFETNPLKELNEAIQFKDILSASRAVHALKGVTLNLGLLTLADPCIEMLQIYRQGNIEEAFKIYPEIVGAFSSFEEAIKPYLIKETTL